MGCIFGSDESHAPNFAGLAKAAFVEFAPLQRGRCDISCIDPNASTHGPPTSSDILVNLAAFSLFTKNSLLTEQEARLHPAL